MYFFNIRMECKKKFDGIFYSVVVLNWFGWNLTLWFVEVVLKSYVDVALLLIGLTHISFETKRNSFAPSRKRSSLIFQWRWTGTIHRKRVQERLCVDSITILYSFFSSVMLLLFTRGRGRSCRDFLSRPCHLGVSFYEGGIVAEKCTTILTFFSTKWSLLDRKWDCGRHL